MHIKKSEEEKSLIADYRSRELNVSRILTLLNIPRSTHYYSPASLQFGRGRKASMITERITDTGIMEITDEQLLLDITGLMGREFVCYSYKKVCKYLQRSGSIINRKKVFRIMEENNLLDYRYNCCSPARRVVESIVSVQKPKDVREIDIKYVYMERTERNTCLRSSTLTPERLLLLNTSDITAPHRM